MCGRYSLTTPPEAMRQVFGFAERPDLAPRYNLAPGQPAPAVRATGEAGGRTLVMLRWGLVPGWAEDPAAGARRINARAETVAEKPSFRAAFRRRRCLIPADGFYEWRRAGGGRRPWHVRRPDGGVLALAGLYERWQAPGGEPLETCAIVTTEANAVVRPIHHRMPVIVAPGAFAIWLEGGTAAAGDLLRPAPDDALEAYPVSRRVNDVRNDDPACLAPDIGGEPETNAPRLL